MRRSKRRISFAENRTASQSQYLKPFRAGCDRIATPSPLISPQKKDPIRSMDIVLEEDAEGTEGLRASAEQCPIRCSTSRSSPRLPQGNF